jgi:hypothetical protein
MRTGFAGHDCADAMVASKAHAAVAAIAAMASLVIDSCAVPFHCVVQRSCLLLMRQLEECIGCRSMICCAVRSSHRRSLYFLRESTCASRAPVA